ncbi:hypothetical protein MANES_02G203601v8 [Manihot esculenta]|uniref:Uncharacterized protein n=1 Tax=Manihot esculenta TaxID=3983 RepID=A0ACB7I9I3_MANES|nr:hypothetical protein MANES_02G203601v8 [Manihot esculenta]
MSSAVDTYNAQYPSFTAKTTIISNPIHSPSFPLSVSVLTVALGFDGELKKPPTNTLRPTILDNACILCITTAANTYLADAYFPDIVIASFPRKEVHDPVANHPLGLTTNHCLGKLLLHQLANQTQVPSRVYSFFCSSAYRILAIIFNCCSPSKGIFLHVTHSSATVNTTFHPTCMC